MTHGLLEASLLSAELSLSQSLSKSQSLNRSEDHYADYTSLNTWKTKQTGGEGDSGRSSTRSQDQLYRSPVRARPLSGTYTQPVVSPAGTLQSSAEVSVSTSNASSEKGTKTRSLTPTPHDLPLPLSPQHSSSSYSPVKSRHRETDAGSSMGVVRPPSLSIDSTASQQSLDRHREKAREVEREKEERFHKLSFRTFHHLGGSNSRPASPLQKHHSSSAQDSSPIHTPFEQYDSTVSYSREASLADLQHGGSAWRNTNHNYTFSASVCPNNYPHAAAAADMDSAVCVTGPLSDDPRQPSSSSSGTGSGLDAYKAEEEDSLEGTGTGGGMGTGSRIGGLPKGIIDRMTTLVLNHYRIILL